MSTLWQFGPPESIVFCCCGADNADWPTNNKKKDDDDDVGSGGGDGGMVMVESREIKELWLIQWRPPPTPKSIVENNNDN